MSATEGTRCKVLNTTRYKVVIIPVQLWSEGGPAAFYRGVAPAMVAAAPQVLDSNVQKCGNVQFCWGCLTELNGSSIEQHKDNVNYCSVVVVTVGSVQEYTV